MIDLTSLKNIYFGLRHGESEANVSGIIAAGEVARSDYGLTMIGEKQVAESVTKAKKGGLLDLQTIILSSPLKRAYETAVVAAEALDIPIENIIVDERLREREFGIFEGQSHAAYREIIWPADLLQKESGHGVEKTDDVKNRVLELLEELEEKYANKNILLVSHGDTLQILETCFKNLSPSEHRSITHVENAEIRRYN